MTLCPRDGAAFGHEWTASGSEIARELGRRTSPAKAAAARRNARLGGWPKGRKRKKKRLAAHRLRFKQVTGPFDTPFDTGTRFSGSFRGNVRARFHR